MAFTYDITSTNQIKMQLASLTAFTQDDGFGAIIHTFTMCKNNNELSDFVNDFIRDEFKFY